MFSQLFAAALLLTSSFATAVPVEESLSRRDIPASTIIADVRAIDKGVNDLRAAVAAYNGGLLDNTPLLTSFTEIHLANRKGFADASLRAADFSASESTAIVDVVVNTVGNDIPAAVRETIAKKPVFDAAGTSQAMVPLLRVLLDDHDTFSAAVTRHLTADRARGAEVVGRIHDAIQRGIDVFSS